MTDIVYVLGNGSKWDNNEIRYSLRSVEKHLKNVGKVFIVGEQAPFLRNVEFIPFDDVSDSKEFNIFMKIFAACENDDVSKRFLFMNDDHFLNEDFNADDFPIFYTQLLHKEIKKRAEVGTDPIYMKTMLNTLDLFKLQSRPIVYTDVHCPITYNKHFFIDALKELSWGMEDYLIKTCYCDFIRNESKPWIQAPDIKIDGNVSWEQLLSLKQEKFFSTSDNLGPLTKLFIDQQYPNPSRYESYQYVQKDLFV